MSDRIVQGCGFVAGTLIHTDRGLVPIQEIRVGDMILSKSEGGTGVKGYKRVTKIMVFEDELVKTVSVYGNGKVEVFVATDNHPFWVANSNRGCKGWTAAELLQMND